MSATTVLNVKSREKLGKGASRAIRREGRIPAVLYGGKEAPIHFSLEPIQLHKEIHTTGFLSKVFEITVNKKAEKALARDVQFHPVTDRPLHVDFQRVTQGEKITVAVPLQFTNETKSPGIKRGGVLNVIIHNLDVLCDIEHIPSAIEISLEGLEIHDTIHLNHIQFPKGVVAAHPERDNDIANIVAPTIMRKTAEDTDTEGKEG